MERDAFLHRVRTAVGAGRLPAAPSHDPGGLVPELPEVDLEERFTAVLTALEGTPLTGDPGRAIVEIADRHQATEFLSWDDLPVAGLIETLIAAGLRRFEVGSSPLSYLPLRLGITGAEAGLAESGSLVLRSGPGRWRMASLVPLVHVALLGRRDLHRSLAHWAATHAGTIAEAANLVIISGPSRTADIEQILTLGVHGPKHLYVILID